MGTAFVHILKTAGSTVNFTMTKGSFWPNDYLILNAGIYRELDWTDAELREFLTWKTDRAFVHNHSVHWSDETIRQYNQQGWLTFSFYRHPGDQWCSYFWWTRESQEVKRRRLMQGRPEPITWDMSLDEFLQLAWSETPSPEYAGDVLNMRANLDLPGCWRELGFVDIWSNENFERFVEKYYQKKDLKLAARNESPNQGYEHYREQGLISNQTHELLMNSARYQDYQSLVNQPHELLDPTEFSARDEGAKKTAVPVWSAIPLLGRFGSESSAAKYVVLAEDGAAVHLLCDYMNDHPVIQAHGREFDRFEQTTSNQKKWLTKFFIQRPNRNRAIEAIGFATGLNSIADADVFREFLEKNQVKVIYLTAKNAISAAISDVKHLEQAAATKTDDETALMPVEQPAQINLSKDEFRKVMERVKQRERLLEYIASLNVPKMELDYERLLTDEAVLLNKLWLFLGVRTAKKRDGLLTDRPSYIDNEISNLSELLGGFPEFGSYFEEGVDDDKGEAAKT